jgi:flagellar export protein FliJ
MKFHFTLNGVLRLRLSLERAELQRLHAIAADVAQARAEIESLEQEREAAQRRVSETVTASGMTGAELQFEAAREAARGVLRAQLMQRLSDLEQKRKEQQARYVHARMQREIISNLYERQLAEYKLEQSRREQQRIDELFLIRTTSAAK